MFSFIKKNPFRKNDGSKVYSAKAYKSSKSQKQAKKNKYKKSDEPNIFDLQLPKKVILAVLIIITSLVGIESFPKKDILPIEKIRLSGQFKNLQIEAVEKKLQQFLGAGFFSVDIKSVQELVATESWVKKVSVRRIWPAQMSVSIVEREAVARWDNSHLLSQQAVVFKAEVDEFEKLPVISGHKVEAENLLKKYYSINARFENFNLTVKELREDNKGSIRLLTDNKLSIKIGSDDVQEKVDQFLKIYEAHITQRVDEINSIDFRYNNGFSISWKDNDLLKETENKRGKVNV